MARSPQTVEMARTHTPTIELAPVRDMVVSRIRGSKSNSLRFELPVRTRRVYTGRKMSSDPPPLREIFLEFASLGDNCEFGLVQRSADAEPLDLLRFAGFYIPVEHRLERLITALASRFDGLGEPDTINPYLDGEPGRREWLVKESAYDLMYHTFHAEGSTDADTIRQREVKRLKFLRDKLFADLESAERIWVWRSGLTSEPAQVGQLHRQLRTLGPNRLLWVVEADAEHPAGKVEWLDTGFMKGYVERFAPYIAATEIAAESWHLMCRNAHTLYSLPQPSLDRPVVWIPWLMGPGVSSFALSRSARPQGGDRRIKLPPPTDST